MGHNLTIRRIADQTGVSVATVSRVLNNKPGISAQARETVLRAVNNGGYRTRAGNTRTVRVALVYATPNPTMVLRGYDADLAAGVYGGVSDQHSQLTITDLAQKSSDENYTQFFLRNNIDGVLLRISSASRQVARDITQEGFPCVVVSDRFDGEKISYVDYDSRPGMARAMDYLFELGHSRIGFALNAWSNDTDHQDRHEAYLEGLKRHAVEYDPALVMTTVTTSIQGGASAVDQFLAMAKPPTAIIFTNPPPTIGGLRRALQRGLSVPDDLSIVGYDNSSLRHSVFPAFSAVYQDAEHIGRVAATSLVDRIRSRSLRPAQVVIPTVFEVNETTGAPRPRQPRPA